MEVIDGATGEIRRAEIFVAVLGTSSYTYAEAVWSQSLPDWIAVHVGMLAFLGGVPRQLVSDNLRAGITRACFYEPLVNRTYADMAAHYGAAVIPARPYKPRDKAKVEVGVQVVPAYILPVASAPTRVRFAIRVCMRSMSEIAQSTSPRGHDAIARRAIAPTPASYPKRKARSSSRPGWNKGERPFEVIPRLAILAREPASGSGAAMGDAGPNRGSPRRR